MVYPCREYYRNGIINNVGRRGFLDVRNFKLEE
nr:MAG TPA: hypothetical protein [Caudoviricetes sp.]